jgi:hypothetical protein
MSTPQWIRAPKPTQEIKEKFAEYSFTRKDFELFAKYKENYSTYALGAMYLAEIEL